MSDDYSLFEQGYEALAKALEQDNGRLNVDVLAQVCALKARAPSSREISLGWASVAIACYTRAARLRHEGFDRQGNEVPLYGLICLMILTWGAQPGDEVLDPELIKCWIQEELEYQENPDSFGEALTETTSDSRYEHVICLRERLEIGLALQERRLLPASFAPWFTAACLHT
jgi:hypothetical protein